MDISIPIIFLVFAFLCWIIALFEERDTNQVSEEEEEKSDNLILLLMSIATVLFIVAGVCMMSISVTYYSPDTNTIEETLMPVYRPLGYIGIGLGILSLILTAHKAFEYLGKQWTE